MVKFRNYTAQPGITEDYHKVRAFLAELGYSEFVYARWDWMITHGYLDKAAVGRIGLWEEAGRIVGLAIYGLKLGVGFCLTRPEHASLKEEMLSYAKDNFANDDGFYIVIPDTDATFQDIAADQGFIATEEKECDAVFYPGKASIAYELPAGFRITSMRETYDLYQYKRVLWKGFNHELNGEGEFTFPSEIEKEADAEMKRANVDLDLKLAVVAPDGNFASYCGMWYDVRAGFGVIEPVATDPDYRRMGLGKAAVLEGIGRVAKMGADRVFVGSSRQFYYSLGMRPYAASTLWRER